MNANKYIEKLDSPLKEVSTALRSIVVALSSEVEEDFKWGVPTYSINRNLCSIMAHKTHVNLQIFQGSHIKDADELEGLGKDMRHLKFSTLDEVESVCVWNYLEQAMEKDSR